jgi:restriction system protein
MERLWMVRSEGGALYDLFRDRSVAAIGWSDLAEHAVERWSRTDLLEYYRRIRPDLKPGTVLSGASQVWRFVNEMRPGDGVVTYSPANRTYLIGTVSGPASFHPDWADEGMGIARPVDWATLEVQRDELSAPTKNALGPTLTVFMLPEHARDDVLARAAGEAPTPALTAALEASGDLSDQEIADPFDNVQEVALERIKDMVSNMDHREMELLVAGVLRAMGYRTQVMPVGPDRGKDIIASPDGFGLETPRIIVEVKHRKDKIDSPTVRSFIGGRHRDDRALYVSTGGFTREAMYEAERAPVPVALWSLHELVMTLIEHYDKADLDIRRMVPLKRMYWPV